VVQALLTPATFCRAFTCWPATSAAGKAMVTPFGNGKPPGAEVTVPSTFTSIVALGSYASTVTETAHW
jgi:hypothetical protein